MEDGNKNTAWIEASPDYGIGEKITIHFNPKDKAAGIPFDGIEITNGYAKSKSAWNDNSRVKLFRLSHNGMPKFYLELEDAIYPQSFYGGRDFLISAGDVVDLEIVDVYPGRKWKDTAISDLALKGGTLA